MEQFIYLDNAATTAMKPEVFEAMRPYMLEQYGNPNSIYTFAQQSRRAIEDAREAIAGLLGAQANEIYFTGGGTESDNWAIKGCAEQFAKKGKHIITTKIEHHAVLHTCAYLEKHGYEVTYLDVDGEGLVNLQELEAAIRPDTVLITVMFANNEIGTVEPIREIGAIAKKHGILFHTDAVQAFGHMPINVAEMDIDMLSASAHKFHGPKGVGFLYVKNSIKLGPFLHGGAQERSRRAGTSNVPGIVGMGEAAKIATAHMEENSRKIAAARDHLITRVLSEIPYSRLNGSRTQRLANNAHFCFRFI